MKFGLPLRQDLLALEVDHNTLRWAHFVNRHADMLDVRFAEAPLEGKNLLELKSRFPASPSRTVLIIKRDELLTKMLRLPSVNVRELSRIVAFTLPQELPYNISEIVYRFDVLSTSQEGFSNVRVVWMLKKSVEEKLELLKSMGLEPDEVIASDQALLFYYLKLRESNASLQARETLLNLESEETEIVAIDGQKILSSYRIKNGFQTLSANPAEFVRTLKENMEDLKKQTHETTASMAFTAVSEIMIQLRENLSKLLDVPIRILPVLGSMDPKKARAVPAAFLGAYFYASFASHPPASLLPEELRKLRHDARSRETLRDAAVYAATFMILTLAGLYCHLLGQSAAQEKLMKEYSKMNASTKRILRVAEEMELLGAIEKEKTVALDFLAALPGLVPPKISLTQIEYDREQGLRLHGIGESNQSITDLMKALKTLPRIKAAEFDFSRRKIQDGKEYFEFQISSKINSAEPENA